MNRTQRGMRGLTKSPMLRRALDMNQMQTHPELTIAPDYEEGRIITTIYVYLANDRHGITLSVHRSPHDAMLVEGCVAVVRKELR